MTCREVEPLLNAYLDYELGAVESASVDRHLAECHACAAHYAALRHLHREIVNGNLDYPLPSRFERKLAARFLPKKEPRRTFGMLAAAACLVILILAFPIIRNARPMEVSAIDTEILDNHLRALQPNHLVDVTSSDQHTVKPWFQGRVSFSPPVRDLANDGFVLLGGRLDVINQEPTAAVVYRIRQHVISLYVMPSSNTDTKTTYHDLGGYHMLHWSDNHLSYWAISDVDPADLRVFKNRFK
jgi:anti-sigma factor RsiW